jgi:hypothetical protein
VEFTSNIGDAHSTRSQFGYSLKPLDLRRKAFAALAFVFLCTASQPGNGSDQSLWGSCEGLSERGFAIHKEPFQSFGERLEEMKAVGHLRRLRGAW